MSTAKLVVLALSISLALCSQPAPSDQLLSVKKICVDKFAGEDLSTAHAREIVIASMFALKRFALTENCGHADAVLKGAVAEKEDQRTRTEGEGAGMSTHSGVGHAIRAVASEEYLSSSEVRRQASVTMRLVNKDGDVLWAHTQDSFGAKSKLAISDAVDRAVKQLIKDMDKLSPPNRPKP